MRKRVFFSRIIAIAVITATLSGFLAGCGRSVEQDTVDKFFSYLQNAEYPRIYQLLSEKAKAAISLVDFSKQYTDVYGKIGLKKAECKLKGILASGSDSKTASFSLTMTTDKLGAFKLEMQAPLVFESGAWFIDWTTQLVLPNYDSGDSVQLITDTARRGEIFDANGELLATNGFAVSVYVNTAEVKDYETLIRLLAPVLSMTETNLHERLRQAMIVSGVLTPTPDPSATPTPKPTPSAAATATPPAGETEVPSVNYVVKAYPEGGLTQEQLTALDKIQGVGIDDSTMTQIRLYPYGNLMAQTLGYMSKMTDTDLQNPANAGLPKDAVIGKTGLEAAFEQELRGQPGYTLVIKDSKNNVKSTLARKKGADGHDLRLTIDIKLQQTAEMLLREYLTPEMAGCIVVTNPKTGYIEAIANAPSFDPNLFSFPVDKAVMDRLLDKNGQKPLNNRATEGRYPPGSTFKPFTASMALTDGVLSANSVFPYEVTNNEWTPGEQFGIASTIRRAEATQGALNMKNAITYSDNIYFAWAAMKIGADSFYQHCLELGFTKTMPFDLPLKVSRISNTGEIRDQRQLADSGYGQGELWITPVQMAMTFGSLANGGDIMVPRIVQSVCHTEDQEYITDKENPKEVWMQGVVPKQNLNVIVPYLKLVAEKGTAKQINKYKNLKDYEICAKTGTAELDNQKTREIAWLIAFTTKEMDRLVCLTLEVPTTQGKIIRTDIAKRMLYAKDTQQTIAEAEAKEKKD